MIDYKPFNWLRLFLLSGLLIIMHSSLVEGEEQSPQVPADHITTWVSEQVDGQNSETGQYTALAMDSSDQAHIVYSDDNCCTLRYAYQDGSNWQLSVVDGEAAGPAALALDQNDYPHIAYVHNSQSVKYAYQDAGGWHLEDVITYPSTTIYSNISLALAADGTPHVSFGEGGGLQYATRNASWQVTTISTAGISVGVYSSLALDASKRVHIAYHGSRLRYIYWTGTTWIDAEIGGGSDGYYAALLLDPTDEAHIIHLDVDSEQVIYTYQEGTNWHSTPLQNNVNPGGNSYSFGLTQAGDGTLHAAFHDEAPNGLVGTLYHAVNIATNWQIRPVNDRGNDGAYLSLALDSQNNPYLSYYDALEEDLRFAYIVALPFHAHLPLVVQ